MTSYTTPAGRAVRIAEQAARLTIEAARRVDWREVALIVGKGLVVLGVMLWMLVPVACKLGSLLRLAIHRAALVIAREHAYMVGVCPPLEALQPVAATEDSSATRKQALQVAPAPAKRPRPQPAPQPVPAMVPAPVVATWPPIDRAVALVKVQRLSQRAAARRAGVSRTSLQRALAVA